MNILEEKANVCGLLSPLVDSSLIWRTNSNSTMLIDHHRFALYNFCPDVSGIIITSNVLAQGHVGSG